MSAQPLRAPFPYFGGKRRAADLIWSALGNVDHYVEPFAGSAAVLLARPHVGRCETVNDLDGMVSNFWRAVKAAPDAVAEACDWPVIEADLHARHLWLIGQRESLTERLIADPEWCDPRAAGWWCWGALAWIGDGWCGDGKPSRKIPNIDARGDRIACASRELLPGTIAAIAVRLRDTRVACGDWMRVLCPATLTGVATVGIYLDPPYSDGAQQYAAGGTGTGLSAQVHGWCEAHGDDKRLRVVLSGYEGEHDALEARGWRVVEWKTKGGYASAGNANQKRERLWLSPACLDATRQRSLFDAAVSR